MVTSSQNFLFQDSSDMVDAIIERSNEIVHLKKKMSKDLGGI